MQVWPLVLVLWLYLLSVICPPMPSMSAKNSLTFYRSSTMQEIFAAIDFAGIAALVTAAGVAIIGINMAFKGITLGKRAVNKA
ncbi:putative major coat protein precursor [Vibrio phage ND1-fs1]|uniref:Putative major coat protein n=2 Tax=Fibrovirus fs1 TaxID=70203 RepID=E1CJD6_9VIRU|nr:putative major coat protein precursor [Vibrio phage VSKK]YP_010083968.1 putative major coat protein precursor [Vibrio phage ND1-fs1]AAL40839.1 putative major coat protein precursor [Vibrio phage VSKK]BAJ12070.1 putative major coat protein precursor [Vibrio phage ND1-fs1]